jgi:glycosyltransferase involved in cell wall biosynthesis
MKISIVIPAFNEDRLLGDTLRHIRAASVALTERGWEPELIVCDNNSTDRTAEIARNAGAQVVFETINQIARARNRGAEAATGDWLVFVDADSRPSRELFDEVADAITSGRCLAGGCTVKLEGSYPKSQFLVGIWNLLSRSLKLLAGSFIFCETAAFRRIGGFNNELFASEELDLTKRLKKLAKEQGRRMVILHRHPLVTSARKMRLYTMREHIRFLARACVRPGKTVTSRDACYLWYDGRR